MPNRAAKTAALPGDGRLLAEAVVIHGAAAAVGIELAAARVDDGCRALEQLSLRLETAAPAMHPPARYETAAAISLRAGDARDETQLAALKT